MFPLHFASVYKGDLLIALTEAWGSLPRFHDWTILWLPPPLLHRQACSADWLSRCSHDFDWSISLWDSLLLLCGWNHLYSRQCVFFHASPPVPHTHHDLRFPFALLLQCHTCCSFKSPASINTNVSVVKSHEFSLSDRKALISAPRFNICACVCVFCVSLCELYQIPADSLHRCLKSRVKQTIQIRPWDRSRTVLSWLAWLQFDPVWPAVSNSVLLAATSDFHVNWVAPWSVFCHEHFVSDCASGWCDETNMAIVLQRENCHRFWC